MRLINFPFWCFIDAVAWFDFDRTMWFCKVCGFLFERIVGMHSQLWKEFVCGLSRSYIEYLVSNDLVSIVLFDSVYSYLSSNIVDVGGSRFAGQYPD